jgi:hypothetical protein
VSFVAISRSRALNRRAALTGLALVAFSVLAACDPTPVPTERDRAEVSVVVGNNGSARADLLLPGLLSRSDLERLAAEARTRLFSSGAAPTAHIDENGAGYPYVVVSAPRAYRPGPRPDFTFDATRLLSMLRPEGFTTVSLSVCGPLVPLDIQASPEPDSGGRCVFWADIALPGPTLRMTMHPSPASFWREVVWLSLAALFDAAGLLLLLRKTAWTTRRRAAIAFFGATSMALCIVGVSSAETVQADNLGVRGELSGILLKLGQAAPALVLPLGIAAVALSILAWTSGRPPTRTSWQPAAAGDPWAR